MTYSYYVDKRTATSADTNLAVGFARLVQMVLYKVGKPADDVLINDCGPYYRIDTSAPIDDQDLQHIETLPFVQHLDTPSQEKALGKHYGHGFPYETQRQIRDAYREKRKELPPEARSPDAYITGHPALAQLEESIPPPDTLLPLYLVISQMKVTPSFNEPTIRWRELSPDLLRMHLRLLLDLFVATPNPLEDVVDNWKKLSKKLMLGDHSMTMLQVINPTTGKGANRTKANALSVGGVKEFWLLELLKFAGFFALAHPQTISNSKDRKTYVLHPHAIQLNVLDQVMRTFRNTLWSNTPVKLDVLAVLQFTRVLVEYEKAALQKEAGKRPKWVSARPADRVQGFDVAFYKDMGSAFAVMNVATLNLPEWIPLITSVEQAERVLTMLKEHIEIISWIRSRKGEERTEEYELLRRYRDFLSGRDIEPFLDFAALYASYLGRKIDRREGHRRFAIESLKELIAMTKQDFVRVVNDQGFQNIADAIRKATVSLQYQKVLHAQGKAPKPEFDIRYGLAQELVRNANDADGLVGAISDFVAKYNNEAAQTFETSKGNSRRRRVTEGDLASVVRLLSEGYKPKTLARLLVAFGSAKANDDPADAVNTPPSSESDQSEQGE